MAQGAIERARAGVTPADSAVLLDGCRAATMLLAAGRREPARSLIRMLARSIAADALPAGPGPALVMLAREFAAWTGDLEFLEKYPVGIGGGGCEAMGVGRGDPLEVIYHVVRGVWGLEPAARAEQLTLVLSPSPGATELALTGVRVGRTTLALRYRRRPEQVMLRCEVTRGPGLRVSASLAGLPGAVEVSVDEMALGAGRAVFRASGSHEVVFQEKGAGGG